MQRALPLSRRLASQFRHLSTTPAPPGTGPNHRSIMALDGNTIRPFVQPNAYVAPSASVIGSVIVNDNSAVMYGAVVRGDLALIHVGAHVIVGDNATLSAGAVAGSPSPADAVATGLTIEPELFVGDYSKIGANATLKGCYLEGDNDVGHCASIGEGARLGRYAVVKPGSAVGDGVEIPEAEVWAGCPARKVGEVSDDAQAKHRKAAELSIDMISRHAYEFLPYGFGHLEKEALEKEAKQDITK